MVQCQSNKLDIDVHVYVERVAIYSYMLPVSRVSDLYGRCELKPNSWCLPFRSFVERSDSDLRMVVGFPRVLPGFLHLHADYRRINEKTHK